MRKPRNRASRVVIALLLIGIVLMATVASHGCDVRGSSPESGSAAVSLEASDSVLQA